MCWCVVLFVVRWTELVVACLCARVCVVVVGLAGLGGWCVLVRVLTELVVCEVRLTQGIVVVLRVSLRLAGGLEVGVLPLVLVAVLVGGVRGCGALRWGKSG